MYLSSTNLVHYLLACGHVTRHEVVHAPFSVFEIDGHHRSFRVACGSGDGLFVKQLKTPNQLSIEFLHREASCYRLAWSEAKFAAWQRLLPGLIGYDPERHIVITQRVAEAEDLVQCHRRLGSFPLDLARLLGTALADFHSTVRELPEGSGSMVQISAPWVFLFHQRSHEDGRWAVEPLSRAIGDDHALTRQLASLQAGWSPESLIHGDLKWSNCLVSPTPDDKPRLHLVDWELARWGDPIWDVAGGLASYVIEAILKHNHYAIKPPQALQSADFIALLQPPMQALWQAYCQRVNLAPSADTEQAIRCIRYLGARLLVAIIEYHPYSPSPELSEPFGVMLEASRTLLRDAPAMAPLLLGGGQTD